jgi:hypothetical protein
MSSDSNFRFVYDINTASDCNISDLLDMYIMQKIIEADNPVNYFSQCFGRAQQYNMEADILKHFVNYILIDMEGNTIQSIVENINEYNLNFIEYFFKNITNENIELINSFKFAYLEIPYGIERLSKLNVLFQSKFIRESMFQEVFKDGVTNEMKGYFTLLSDIPSKSWDVNIDPIKPLLDRFISDPESCSKLVKLIHQHLNLNVSYSFSQHKFININRCASIKYVCFLVKMMLYIFETSCGQLSTFTLSKVPRADYALKDGDSLLVQIVITTLYSLKVGYVPLARIYHVVEKERQAVGEEFDFTSSANQGSLRRKNELELQFSRINGIFKDKKFHNSMLYFVETISKHDIFISDDVVHNINDFVIGCIIDHEMRKLPISIINYLLKVIHGDYGANKHERFTVCMTLIVICDHIGYSFFNDLNDHNMSITTQMFFSVLKLIVNVDHFEWTQLKLAHKFYQEMMGILSYYSNKLNLSLMDPDEISRDVSLLFHKITSKMNTLITDMKDVCRRIVEAGTHATIDMDMILDQYKHVINDYITTFISCIQALQNLIASNILDIKNLPMELILPMSAFSVALLTLLSNGKGPIYTVFHMNMETLTLMQELFKLINMGCSNSKFTDSIRDNIGMINEMVKRVKLDGKLKDSLVNYLGNLDRVPNDASSELPDEFIDPILAIEIKNPVMIPKRDEIFDKGSIMSHLYGEETNPFTREVLTIREFEEYNKRSDIKDKISIFINRLADYKKAMQ